MEIVKRVGRYASIPRGYGLVYRDHRTLTTVVAPVPLHWLLSWCREAWYWILTSHPRWSEEREIALIKKAMEDGSWR